MFQLKSSFIPTGDQPQAIEKLVSGVQKKNKNQVLLGVTGSGKTFTLANVIQRLQKPALIISHNKTLAGQLYQEMRDFFPTNGVSYFVSYYDYYQPEAYIPQTDTYIEKESQINEQIDKLRLQTTTNIMTRRDVIVVASVSCIYNIGSPFEYGKFIIDLKKGDRVILSDLMLRLAGLQYERSEFEFKRGTFRIRGNKIDIYPAYEDIGYRITTDHDTVTSISRFEPLGGTILDDHDIPAVVIFPAKHFMMDRKLLDEAEKHIRIDLKHEHAMLKKAGKNTEAERLLRRVNYDLEMIREVGYVNGIENYSRYFDGRKKGQTPYSLITYFQKAFGDDFIVCIDESHMTVPQIRGMYNGDWSRKKMLIDFGFRLQAALDNRPLTFEEFYLAVPHIIYTSATPDEWELQLSTNTVEQLVRPTGITDPSIEIRPAASEVQDLIAEIEKRVKLNQKILVTTLTKKIAEDLSQYLRDRSVRAEYLHSDVETLERSDILDNLRKGTFDVLIGVNLLREGLDLPEVYLVAILDADKEGFLRSKTALIQTMGRAARNISGSVILYADKITNSMKGAIDEISRRRQYQVAYNKKNKISPKTIIKPIRERIVDKDITDEDKKGKKSYRTSIAEIDSNSLTPYDTKKLIKRLELEMKRLANDMRFEDAIEVRDKIRELKQIINS